MSDATCDRLAARKRIALSRFEVMKCASRYIVSASSAQCVPLAATEMPLKCSHAIVKLGAASVEVHGRPTSSSCHHSKKSTLTLWLRLRSPCFGVWIWVLLFDQHYQEADFTHKDLHGSESQSPDDTLQSYHMQTRHWKMSSSFWINLLGNTLV